MSTTHVTETFETYTYLTNILSPTDGKNRVVG